jgi:hypothetical protein
MAENCIIHSPLVNNIDKQVPEMGGRAKPNHFIVLNEAESFGWYK